VTRSPTTASTPAAYRRIAAAAPDAPLTTLETLYEDGHLRATSTDRRGTQTIQQMDSRQQVLQVSRRIPTWPPTTAPPKS